MVREAGTLKTTLLSAALIGGLALPATAQAQGVFTGNELELSATATFTTDYVFRGISQTGNDPAVQASFDAAYGIFYAGMWGSNVDFGAGDPADLELNFYGGVTPSWAGFDFDLGVISYVYPDTPNGYNIVEGKIGASRTFFDALTVGATAYLSDRNYQAYEFAGEYGFTNNWWMFSPSVSALVGFVETDGSFVGTDYTYWNAGLTLGFLDNWSADIRYWDSDLSDFACGGSFCDSRVVGTVSASF